MKAPDERSRAPSARTGVSFPTPHAHRAHAQPRTNGVLYSAAQRRSSDAGVTLCCDEFHTSSNRHDGDRPVSAGRSNRPAPPRCRRTGRCRRRRRRAFASRVAPCEPGHVHLDDPSRIRRTKRLAARVGRCGRSRRGQSSRRISDHGAHSAEWNAYAGPGRTAARDREQVPGAQSAFGAHPDRVRHCASLVAASRGQSSPWRFNPESPGEHRDASAPSRRAKARRRMRETA
jgi:hypothetical protein